MLLALQGQEIALWVGVGLLFLITLGFLFFLLTRKSAAEAESKAKLETLVREIAELRKEQFETKTAIAQSQIEGVKQASESVTKQVGESIRTLNESLSQTLNLNQQQISSTHKVVAAVNEQLGALGKSTERIHEIGREIRSLQDVLQAPKLRGNFGEFLLQELLQSMLPADHFEVSHSFKDGTCVDAVVRISDKLISIDSKFPLESFRRMTTAENESDREIARKEFIQSARLRVDEIADKYIRPEEETYGFALMYLPSEAIYYEIVVREQNLGDARSPLQYALSRKVIPVSPSSFYAYLATIAFGLRGMQIEKQAEEIRGRVGKLQTDFGRFLDALRGVDKNLDIAKRKFDEVLEKGTRLHGRMSKVSGVELEESEESKPTPLPPIVDLPTS